MVFLLQIQVRCHPFEFVIIHVIYHLYLCLYAMSNTSIIKTKLQGAHLGSKESEIKIIHLPSGLISRYVKNKSS